MPLKTGKEAFHQPTSLVTAQAAAILRALVNSVAAVQRDHLDVFLAQFLIQLIAVVGAIADWVLTANGKP